MKIEYNWSRADLKKELLSKRFKTNIIFFILSIVLYIWFMYAGIVSDAFDNLVIFIGGVVYLFVVSLLLFIFTKIYVTLNLKRNDKNTNKAYGKYIIKTDDNKIEVLINKDKYEYNFSDITQIKSRRNSFFIKTKEDKIGLTFKRKLLNEDYDNLYNHIKSHIKG